MENKVVLVTGASRGIGKAIAIAFGKAGYSVVINYRGSKEQAQEVLDIVSEYSKDSILVQADISKEEDVKELFKTIQDTYGRLDVCVNNSGITRDGLILRMKTEDFMSVIDTNLKGTFLCCKYAANMMIRQKEGSIINMASVVGIHGNAGQTNYAASKAGVIGLTKSLAKEIGSRHVRVNAIAPGFIQTQMTESLKESVKEQMEQSISLKSLGQPEDIAQLALFLASANSQYITGQVIQVDGGMMM